MTYKTFMCSPQDLGMILNTYHQQYVLVLVVHITELFPSHTGQPMHHVTISHQGERDA